MRPTPSHDYASRNLGEPLHGSRDYGIDSAAPMELIAMFGMRFVSNWSANCLMLLGRAVTTHREPCEIAGAIQVTTAQLLAHLMNIMQRVALVVCIVQMRMV